MSRDGCGCDRGGSGDRPPADARLAGTLKQRSEGNPVLGPNLGGGIVGSGLTASGSLPVPGGGVIQPNTHVNVDTVHYPQVRQDVHFDYSTVAMLSGPRPPKIQALLAEWGGVGTTQP